jgi:DNA ligase-1
MEEFKTMLAVKGSKERLREITKEDGYVLVSPKLDGIRCIVHPTLGPVSRTLKPIPNKHIRDVLSSKAYEGMDGEIMVDGDFSDVQSAVMSHEGKPKFIFNVFDLITEETKDLPFSERLDQLSKRFARHKGMLDAIIVPHYMLMDAAMDTTLDKILRLHLDKGFEGTMFRSPSSPYKFGRSTLKQGYLLKLKPVADCEVLITGIKNLVDKHGNEEQTTGAIEGIILNGDFEGEEISVGTGMTASQRKEFYNRKFFLIDNKAKFTIEYQLEGSKDKPRFPSFKGFRDEADFMESA